MLTESDLKWLEEAAEKVDEMSKQAEQEGEILIADAAGEAANELQVLLDEVDS